jgi:5,6-dimethylbenzimidazole synthase
VSIFDPSALASLLGMPEGGRPVAVLCIGPVEAFPPAPLLETGGWGRRLGVEEVLFEDAWREGARGTAPQY